MASNVDVRKKSPRAPSIALEEALDRAIKVYEKERLHGAPADVVAQHMGYKDANNGRALAALASLRYYGLVERTPDGLIAASKDVEAYKYAPSEALRTSYLRRFLTTPPLFAELLDRYSAGLPSEGNLRYELIQRGFLPSTAESLVGVLKRSADFARVFEEGNEAGPGALNDDESQSQSQQSPAVQSTPASVAQRAAEVVSAPLAEDDEHDRIPVRLSGGRRAWLVIPATFYRADKQRLKAQIDLLLTEDEEGA